jgi:hypothetical protein
MVGVEIHRDDVLGPGCEIIQDIASARGDRDQAVLWPQLQGFKVDSRIFPDLIVDKSLEHQGEQALQRAQLGGRGALMRGAIEKSIAHGAVFQTRGGRGKENLCALQAQCSDSPIAETVNTMALRQSLRHRRAVSKESR